MAVSHLLIAAMLLGQSQGAPVTQLPVPTRDPLAIQAADDPILALARGSVSVGEFMALVQQAVHRHPQIDEAVAGISEAEAGHDEARAGLFPRVDLGINSQRTIARNFEGGPLDNFLERSRPKGRTDITATVEQTLFDFGATDARIVAAGARLRAASLRAEEAADRTALRAIAAWYDVFAYRALVILGSAFSENQQELRGAVQERITAGVSAPGDLPRVESYIASSQADLARYRRLLANAEARFEELFGAPPPPDLGRAPPLGGPAISKEMAQLLARVIPEVEGAEALARAARQDAKSQRAQTLPNVTAGVDAGKYGLNGEDYDVRGRITVRQRFFGGIGARVDQAEARAAGANARASRIRVESEREAAIAWSDVRALEQQLTALESSYLASRQSRDVLAERFRVARGTLFDLLEAESAYFNVA
ncbi:MAG TPA: TolC family protein, partial [Allosphingosinicella sp.]